MNIEIWSDVVCPWCYIGKRRLERAVEAFEHGREITVRWRSFELNPDAPRRETDSLEETLSRKYGMSREQAQAANERITEFAKGEGLEYHLDRARSANSFDSHRLIHLAADHGLQGEMKERLMHAHFTETVAIGDPEVLIAIASEVGLEEQEAREVLDGERYAQAVREDEATARSLGIGGVPFFLIEGKWGISGAQPLELFSEALTTTWAKLHTAVE